MKLPDWWNHDKPYKIMDCLEGMKELPDKCVDLVLTDPPYGLAGGYVCRSGKGEVFAEEWDTEEEMIKLTEAFIFEVKRLLKDEATLMVSGTHHNYPYVGYYMKQNGYYIINDIVWVKPNPPPTMHHSKLCPATETILWARCGKKHHYDYDYAKKLNNGKQAKNVLYFATTEDMGDAREHPTQKPSELWEYLINIGSKEGGVVLDPFLGSGTTLFSTRRTNRIGLGFEINPDYEPIIRKRSLQDIKPLEGYF